MNVDRTHSHVLLDEPPARTTLVHTHVAVTLVIQEMELFVPVSSGTYLFTFSIYFVNIWIHVVFMIRKIENR